MKNQEQSESQASDDQPPSCENTANNEAAPICSMKGSTEQIEVVLLNPLNLLTATQSTQLTQWATLVLAQLPNSGEVRVRVVDDRVMIQDHLRFSGLETTTDVLTFDLSDPVVGSSFNDQTREHFDLKVLDVDLTICFDEAKRQADQRSHTPIHELLLYIVHGTLHCLGYDDHTEEQYETMHQREDELLKNAGFSHLFYSEISTQTSENSKEQSNTFNKEHA